VPSYLIRPKLIFAFMTVAMITLILSGLINLALTHRALMGATKLAIMGAAVQTADSIDAFIIDNLNMIRTQSLLPSIVEYLESPPEGRTSRGLEYRVMRVLDSFRRRDQVNISSYAIFDAGGVRLADTYGDIIQYGFEREYLSDSIVTGLPAVSPVLNFRESGIPSICFGSPVRNAYGQIVGIIRVRYNINAVQKLVHEKEGLLGTGSAAILIDEDGIRIADSHDASMLFKPLVPLEPAVSEKRKAGSVYFEELAGEESCVMLSKGLAACETTPHFSAVTHPRSGEEMLCAAIRLKSRPWTLVFAQPRMIFLTALNMQVIYSIILLVGITAVAMTAAFFIANKIARPIVQLTAVAKRVANGELDQRIRPGSGDEIGQFTDAFNAMTAALQASQHNLIDYSRRLEALYDTIPDAIFIHRADGSIVDMNRRAIELYGFTREEILTGGIAAIDGTAHSREMIDSRFVHVMESGREDFEWTGRRNDGTEFPVYVRLRCIPLEGEDHIIAVVTDMSERMRLEAQLLHAQKLEAIGTLAGGIAHDFNNMLAGILGYCSLMLLSMDKKNPHYEHLVQIEEQVRSGTHLTQQLLGFARGGKYTVKPIDLNQLVARTSSTFGRTKKEVSIVLSLAEDLLNVEADQSQIEQVLVNLYVNAWQAMPGGGTLSLETRNTALDEDTTRAHGLQPGPLVRLSISDTGIGMDEETRSRIFEPFFTTKEMGHGTGLGLASVYGIIKNHGGIITVTSQPGRGTTFVIHLRATDKPVSRSSELNDDIRHGDETILLVDDEEVILKVTGKILHNLGYRVLSARTGQEAIDMFRQRHGEIDLVILDMIMPEMGGGEVFDAMKAVNPSICALLSSGYSINDSARVILEHGCAGFIQKPFNIAELSQQLRAVLDQKSRGNAGSISKKQINNTC